MNIIMALSQLEVTGAEIYATTIADELINRGNNVYIFSDTLNTKTKARFIKLEFNKRTIFNRIKHIKTLYKFIKENDIHIIHANSRASSWSSQIACKLAGIPLITTTHGKQPIHFSRKLIKAFGDYSIAVCENIKNHMSKEIGFSEKNISIIRNPINFDLILKEKILIEKNNKKIISIIGRLSGPKGKVAYNLLEFLTISLNLNDWEIRVIGGQSLPKEFIKFKEKGVNFLGHISDIINRINESDIIIGAGRVAIEALLLEKPIIAVGESKYIGHLNNKNIQNALNSNFGDISNSIFPVFSQELLMEDINKALLLDTNEKILLKEKVKNEVSLKNIVDKIEKLYFNLYVKIKKYEVPVIMYHRVINSKKDEGIYGTYIYEDIFIKHMQYLKDNNYDVITFEDLKKIGWRNRFQKNKKYIILTFDDGYEDNYKIAFPILKKFNFKACIFLMASSTYNEWDVKDGNEMKFSLMSEEMIKEMQDYGIEFGAHTFNHPKLNEISKKEIEHQILDSKKILEEKINKKIITFAYPYGILNDYAKKIVAKSKFDFGLATDSGGLSLSEDLYQIRRIAIFPNTNLFKFKRKVKGNYNFIKIKRESK